MDEPRWAGLKGQENILTQLSPLLEVTIVNEKTSIDAFDRLLVLAQHKSEEVSGAAQRALKEVISYRKYKHVIFNERILALVEKRAADISSYKGRFTPLDLMDELLDREVDVNELKGRAFSISALPVNYEVIKGLRERAFKVINHALYAAEPRIGVRAARSLGSVVAEFHPKFRSGINGNEREWQDAERLRALELLQKRVQAGNISLPLLWKIHRILRWTGRRTAQSAEVQDRAAAIQVELPRLQLFDMFNLLCTDEYEENTEAEGYHVPSLKRREQQDAALGLLRGTFPTTHDQLSTIEGLIRQAVDASIEPKALASVLSHMCQARPFLQVLSEYVLTYQDSILASVGGVPIAEWRSVDSAQYVHYGLLFAASPNLRLANSTASAVSYGPPLRRRK